MIALTSEAGAISCRSYATGRKELKSVRTFTNRPSNEPSGRLSEGHPECLQYLMHNFAASAISADSALPDPSCSKGI